MAHDVAENGQHLVRFRDQQLNFHEGLAQFLPAAGMPCIGSTDICFRAEGDLEEIKTELIENGIDIELGPVVRNGARGPMNSIYMRDPDGNLVEICVYPKM